MRSPSLFELMTLGAGVALLATFVHVRADQEARRESAVQAFLQTHPEPVLAVPASTSAQPDRATEVPDQSLWSEERIHAYAESRSLGGDAPLGVLEIGRLGITVPVYDGADDHNLNRGVARVRGTARIDTVGNLGIAGHRDGFFRGLKDIQRGDVIELRTSSALVKYQVVSTRIVQPEDVEVLAPTSESTLTLVTCYPFYFVGSAPQRFIVKAVAQQHHST